MKRIVITLLLLSSVKCLCQTQFTFSYNKVVLLSKNKDGTIVTIDNYENSKGIILVDLDAKTIVDKEESHAKITIYRIKEIVEEKRFNNGESYFKLKVDSRNSFNENEYLSTFAIVKAYKQQYDISNILFSFQDDVTCMLFNAV